MFPLPKALGQLEVSLFLFYSLKSALMTFLWVPAYIYRALLIKYVSLYHADYGRILSPYDLGKAEDYTEDAPKNTMVFTMVLDGPMELEELRCLFRKNVLECKIHDKKTGKDNLRYPELRQYEENFWGHKFFRDDPSFKLENHLTQMPFKKEFEEIAKIHQEFTNKLYAKQRSPWELVLVPEYHNDPEKTLLIFRSHHTLGDTKAIMKLLVECLAQKELKMPEVKYSGESWWHQLKFYLWLPFYFVFVQVFGHVTSRESEGHPLKFSDEVEPHSNVGISKPLKLSMIKEVAKRGNVTSSAVIMAAIAGGVARSNSKLEVDDILCLWVLPREGHPDHLANHNFSGIIKLPTSTAISNSVSWRLKQCEDIFRDIRSTNFFLWRYMKAALYQKTTWINPVRNYLTKGAIHPLPITLTNIAGEGEGISIGGLKCSEMIMTCGPLHGRGGMLICLFSYKDNIYVTIAARDKILKEWETQALANLIEKEFHILKNNP